MVNIPQFPTFPGRAFPMKRRPEVKTTRLTTQSGRRFAEPRWPYPIYHYEIDISVLRTGDAYQEYQTFQGFWNQVMTTPGQLFIFVDRNDGVATNQFIGTGDGSRTLWQAMRTMGGFIEPVTAVLQNDEPVTSTIDCGAVTDSVTQTIDNGNVTDTPSTTTDCGGLTLTHFFVDGVEVSATIFAGGALLFDVPPAAGSAITWTGIYGWLCQFDEDDADLENFLYQLYDLSQLTFTTARPTV